MAFVVGTGQSLATRWANMLELAKCKLGPLSIPAGDIEIGIDYTQCGFFIQNVGGPKTYIPIDIDSTISTLTISGADPGMSSTLGRDGLPLPNAPLTNLYIYTDTAANPGIYVDDSWLFRLRSEVMRERVVNISHLNLQCLATPDPITYPGSLGHAGRYPSCSFIKEQCQNDSLDMTTSPGNHTTLTNVHVLGPMTGWYAFIETSSGSYSEINLTDCTIRGWGSALQMFGNGPTVKQPLGKRLNMYRCNTRACYGQPPGAELTGVGGNGIYIHPPVKLHANWCEWGAEFPVAGEYVAERAIYWNGGATGFAPDLQLIENCIFWPNNIQGIKCGSTRYADGTQGAIEIANCRLLSAWKALTNDDGDVWVHDCEIGPGEVSGGLNDPATKIGYGLLVEDFTMAVSQTTPATEYRGGQTEVISSGGQATFRRGIITISAQQYSLQCSTGSKLVAEDVVVNAVGSSANTVAAFLLAAKGLMELRRVTVTGAIRPFYWQRPPSLVDQPTVATPAFTDSCDFSACTIGYRVLLDSVGSEYRTYVDSATRLPDQNGTITGTHAQSWSHYAADAAATVASATTLTLAPDSDRVTVSGSASIATIHEKATVAGAANMLWDQGYRALRVGPTASWKLLATGNIVPLHSNARTPGEIVVLRYSAGTAKWTETADSVAPTFAGATSISPTSHATADVAWIAARDLGSESSAISYLIYLSRVSGAQNFSAPSATVAGAVSATLAELLAGTSYYAVVRARDAAGNIDSNVVEVSARTLDVAAVDGHRQSVHLANRFLSWRKRGRAGRLN